MQYSKIIYLFHISQHVVNRNWAVYLQIFASTIKDGAGVSWT